MDEWSFEDEKLGIIINYYNSIKYGGYIEGVFSNTEGYIDKLINIKSNCKQLDDYKKFMLFKELYNNLISEIEGSASGDIYKRIGDLKDPSAKYSYILKAQLENSLFNFHSNSLDVIAGLIDFYKELLELKGAKVKFEHHDHVINSRVEYLKTGVLKTKYIIKSGDKIDLRLKPASIIRVLSHLYCNYNLNQQNNTILIDSFFDIFNISNSNLLDKVKKQAGFLTRDAKKLSDLSLEEKAFLKELQQLKKEQFDNFINNNI